MALARYKVLLLAFCWAAAFAGCSQPAGIGTSEVEYIRTTVDLVRARNNLPPGTDSLSVRRTIDAVLSRHHTTSSQYNLLSRTLADDPEKAQKVFEAVRDSLKAK